MKRIYLVLFVLLLAMLGCGDPEPPAASPGKTGANYTETDPTQVPPIKAGPAPTQIPPNSNRVDRAEMLRGAGYIIIEVEKGEYLWLTDNGSIGCAFDEGIIGVTCVVWILESEDLDSEAEEMTYFMMEYGVPGSVIGEIGEALQTDEENMSGNIAGWLWMTGLDETDMTILIIAEKEGGPNG